MTAQTLRVPEIEISEQEVTLSDTQQEFINSRLDSAIADVKAGRGSSDLNEVRDRRRKALAQKLQEYNDAL